MPPSLPDAMMTLPSGMHEGAANVLPATGNTWRMDVACVNSSLIWIKLKLIATLGMWQS